MKKIRTLPLIVLSITLLAVTAIILFAVYRGTAALVQHHLASSSDAALVLLATAMSLLASYGAITFLVWTARIPGDE